MRYKEKLAEYPGNCGASTAVAKLSYVSDPLHTLCKMVKGIKLWIEAVHSITGKLV